jgi:crotonobetainyl-CoA:carnitine CoA-transferase CaiB-like acyl-CoA transferase
VQRLTHPGVGEYRVVGPPVRLDEDVLVYPLPAPVLGADTRAALAEVGVSDAEVDALITQGVAVA